MPKKIKRYLLKRKIKRAVNRKCKSFKKHGALLLILLLPIVILIVLKLIRKRAKKKLKETIKGKVKEKIDSRRQKDKTEQEDKE